MNFKEAILTRRSIRKFDSTQKPSREKIVELVKSGMYAPSAHNHRPWEFVIIQNDSTLKTIEKIHPYCPFASTAGSAILVCGNLQKQYYSESGEGYWTLDCSAATQNILISARGAGLGTCWCGIYPVKERMKDFSALLNLPAHISPLALIVVGAPMVEQDRQVERFESEKLHFEKWQA